MGWLWSSSPSERKAEPQQPTPTSIPIRTSPDTAAPTSQPTPTQAQQNAAAFDAAYPHLASPPPTTEDTAAADHDPSLPTTMSCRAAFDNAFYCSSLGGHFNDIYRYGQLRSCSEHWADWRFCMALKSSSAERQTQAIQARYREKDEKLKGKASSEDVWERRGPGEMIERPFGKAEEEARRVEGS